MGMTKMVNKQELMSKLEDMNEEAHQYTMKTWLEADRLEADDLLDEAEAKREEASEEQSKHFEDSFDLLPAQEQTAVWDYVETDPDGFGEQFYQWYRH
jgi:hypothetical protein